MSEPHARDIETVYQQKSLGVEQPLWRKLRLRGLTANSGAGTIAPDTIGELIPLIEAGIR